MQAKYEDFLFFYAHSLSSARHWHHSQAEIHQNNRPAPVSGAGQNYH
jgi:hypothetical protein